MGENSINMLKRTYREKRQSCKFNANVSRRVEQMLNGGKAVGANGDNSPHTRRRKDAATG